MLHPDKRRIFEVRAQVINYVRRFLDEKNFLEVTLGAPPSSPRGCPLESQ